MLGTGCLSLHPAWQCASGKGAAGAGCRTPDGVAVAYSSAGALLLGAHEPLEVPGGHDPAACTPGGVLLLGEGPGRLLRVPLQPGLPLAPALIALETPEDAPASAIAAQSRAERFAVALGRYIHVLDGECQQLRRLGPLPAPVTQLAWAGARGDTLLAATPGGLHTWSDGGAAEGPVLGGDGSGEAPQPQFLRMAAAPHAPLVAVSSGIDQEVHCWELAALLGGGAGAAAPLRLPDFESHVSVLEWDASGRYLATADCADCAVWDLCDASGAERAASVACCGHEPRTAITCLAFQPGGHLLATAGSSGKVALFDCRQFRRGGVLAPMASAQLDPAAADAATVLVWLPDGRLAVGGASGRLVCFELQQQAQQQAPEAAASASALASGLASMHVGAGPAESDAAAPAAEAAAQPAAGGAAAAAMAAATAAAAAAMTRPGRIAANGGATSNGNGMPAAGPGTPRGHSNHEAAVSQLDAAAGGAPGPRWASHSQPVPAGHGRLSDGGGRADGSGPGRWARGTRGGASRGGSGGDASAAGGGAAGPAGFSASLMSHIQAIRDNPPAREGSRGDSQQLAGWGLGSPSGAQVPWMVVGPGGVPMAAPRGASYGPAGFSQYQAPAAPQFQAQAAMMQRMAQPGGAGMPHAALYGTSPGGGGPGSPQAAQAAAYQQQAAAAMQQQAAMYGASAGGGMGGMPLGVPMGSMGSGGAPGGAQPQWVMMAPPAYMQQMQMQQWAGIAPGYMAYQHPQQYPQHACGAPGVGLESAGSGAFSPRSGGAGYALPPRMDSALGGVGGSRRQESLDSAAAAAMEAAEGGPGGRAAGRPRAGRTGSFGSAGGGATAATAAAAARNGRELLNQLQAAAAAEEAVAEQQQLRQEAKEEQGNDDQGSASPAAAEEAAAAATERAHSLPPAGARQWAPRDTALSPARSGDLNNSDTGLASDGGQPGAEGASPGYSPAPSSPSHAADAGAAAISISTIYVGNLPGTVDEYTLMCAFAPFGPITHVQVIKEKGSQLSRGYGFVSFAHPLYATMAMQQMNQQVLFGPFAGSRIKVAPSKRH